MTAQRILLTQADHQRLSQLLQVARRNKLEDACHLNDLASELDSATVVPGPDMPDDVVTLHTRVRLEFPHTARPTTCQLVLPTELNMAAGRVSVLSPLGTALIGRRTGDDVDYSVRGIRRSVRVLGIVYQPESAERRQPRRAAPPLIH